MTTSPEMLLPEWEDRLAHAITLLQNTRDRLHNPALVATATERLSTASLVAEALELLTPTKKMAGNLRPSFLTTLVRSSRDEATLTGEQATWQEIAQTLQLSSPQRAYDLHSDASPERRAAAREAAARARAQLPSAPPKELPGISTADAETHFKVSRTRIRSMVAEGLLHAYPLLDQETGQPILLKRAGKLTPSLRYYLRGKPLSEAAAELGVSEEEVVAMAERGEMGRSRVLDAETHEPVMDAAGEPVWQYWPEHKAV